MEIGIVRLLFHSPSAPHPLTLRAPGAHPTSKPSSFLIYIRGHNHDRPKNKEETRGEVKLLITFRRMNINAFTLVIFSGDKIAVVRYFLFVYLKRNNK